MLQNIAVTTTMLLFVSYGGTNLIFSLATLDMLVCIHRRSHVRVLREFPLTPETRLAVRL